MNAKFKYCELIGMFLIITSTAWQIFISSPLVEIENSARAYDRDRKLDVIWSVLAETYTREYPDQSDGLTFTTNIQHHNDQWKYAEQSKDESIEWQAKAATWVTAIFFLIGSVLVLVAKYLEIQHSKEN